MMLINDFSFRKNVRGGQGRSDEGQTLFISSSFKEKRLIWKQFSCRIVTMETVDRKIVKKRHHLSALSQITENNV